ncbi:hypothetical protein KR018_007492 [Drosophila ironensis]|nr:hypothetical protein KR018_007492 [Drosophila ironensis]
MIRIGLALCFVAVISIRPCTGSLDADDEKSRTALPWLLLLAYPGAVPQIGAPLPGIPVRRPQDEVPVRRPQNEAVVSGGNMKLPQSDESSSTLQINNAVREQFLQGVLQGLQPAGVGGTGPTISPAALADFLAQATTSTTPKSVVEKDAGNDEDYDYIDFKNGSRIKYDLDEPVNKILQPTTKRPSAFRPANPSSGLSYRLPTTYVYYRPAYYPTRFG